MRNIRSRLLLFLLLVAFPLLALVVTDNFNRANEALNVSANWDAVMGGDGLRVIENKVAVNSAANAYSMWVGTFADNQYSQFTITDMNAGNYLGPIVRSSVNNAYYVFITPGSVYVGKLVAGVETNFTDANPVTGLSYVVSDVIRLEAEGTTVRLKKNGNQVYSTVDSSLGSGRAGICGVGTSTWARGDDWGGGDLAVSAVARRRVVNQ